MSLNVIPLNEIMKSEIPDKEIHTLLNSFTSLKTQDSVGADDVEFFLHNKALQFEKLDLSRTYLVMSTYKSKAILVGYFSIANKPLIIQKREFSRFSKTLQKRLMGVGYKGDQSSFVIKGYLLGQLGKNFSEESLAAKCCNGNDLLQLAYRKVADAHRIVGGRILHLECENVEKIINFYRSNGFSQIDGFESENKYCMMVKHMSDVI